MKGISGFFLVSALAAMTAAPLAAQSVPDEPLSVRAQSLDLPSNVTIFGKRDPRIHKASAVVNGQIITQTDIEHRVALVLFSNSGVKITDQQREELRLQMLRGLIDETLEIQEAAANDIVIEPAKIEAALERYVAQNFQMTVKRFDEAITKAGSSPQSVRRQIEGQLAWDALQERIIYPFVNVSEDEVQGVINRLLAAKGTDELRVSEIYLNATPENQQQVMANARNLTEQLVNGASFPTFARTYSEASTAATNGDLGWIRPSQLPPELEAALSKMQVNQIAGPIQTAGGFSILWLSDKRKVLTADPRDSILSLKQVEIQFPKGATEAQINARVASFGEKVKQIKGCGNANAVAKELGADVVDNDGLPVRSIDIPELQTMLLNMKVGEATPPFGSQTEGVRVLVICGREDPREANAPSANQVRDQMMQAQIDKRAQTKLRDLRRDAVIEYN